MKRKCIYGVIVLAAIIFIGTMAYTIWDSLKSGDEMTEIEQGNVRTRKALAQALGVAREKVRADIRKKDEQVRKEGGDAAAKARAAEAERRRTAVRRMFFGGGGFTMTAAYRKACEMPEGDPTPEDQEIIDLAADSSSEADLDTAAEVTQAALASKDPRARIAAVEMLSALGEVGLADIGEFLTDPHPEVANLAADRWELGVQDIMDEATRTSLVKVGLLAITDEDQLRSMTGTLLMANDELLIIQTVADVMRDGRKEQRDAVKSAYETITGETWKNEEEAEKWLQANYEPPPADDPEEDSSTADETDDDASSEEE